MELHPDIRNDIKHELDEMEQPEQVEVPVPVQDAHAIKAYSQAHSLIQNDKELMNFLEEIERVEARMPIFSSPIVPLTGAEILIYRTGQASVVHTLRNMAALYEEYKKENTNG